MSNCVTGTLAKSGLEKNLKVVSFAMRLFTFKEFALKVKDINMEQKCTHTV